MRSAQSARVLSIQEEKKFAQKPLGLNTVTLLKACSKGLGLSPTSAMHAAEHLYTSGYISYPRTETSQYPPSFDLMAALEEQANHPNCTSVSIYLFTAIFNSWYVVCHCNDFCVPNKLPLQLIL